MQMENEVDQTTGSMTISGHVVTDTGSTDVVSEPEGNPELRAALKREQEKAASYRGELLGIRLTEIGLKPDAGLGKAIAKEYDGDLTTEALSAYAQEEYAYEGSVEQQPAEVATAERIEQLGSVSEAVTPPPEVDQAAEITDKMDDPESGRNEAEASVAVKTDQFFREHYG